MTHTDERTLVEIIAPDEGVRLVFPFDESSTNGSDEPRLIPECTKLAINDNP